MDYLISRAPEVVLFMGDMVDTNNATQWAVAAEATARLTAAGIKWIPALGNHDANTDRSTLMNTYLTAGSWIGGYYQAGHLENTWSKITISGHQWLILSLEFGPRDDVVTWANSIIKANPTLPTIIVTHAYLYYDGNLYTNGLYQYYAPASYVWTPSQGCNDGASLWTKLISGNSNIKFVFCGHTFPPSGYGTAERTTARSDSTLCHQMLQDFQELSPNGQSWVRELSFDYTNNLVYVSTYSPLLSTAMTTSDEQFVLTMP